MTMQPWQQTQSKETYADSVRMSVGAFSVSFSFELLPAHPNPLAKMEQPQEVVRVRMSPEHAKVMAMLLWKNLHDYEARNNLKIALPEGIYKGLNLEGLSW